MALKPSQLKVQFNALCHNNANLFCALRHFNIFLLLLFGRNRIPEVDVPLREWNLNIMGAEAAHDFTAQVG